MAAGNDIFKTAKVNLAKKQNLVKKVKKELKKAQMAMEKAKSRLTVVENKLEVAENELQAAKMQVQIMKRKGYLDEIFWKFPHIGEQIIEKLDNKSLVKCKEVNALWLNFINEGKAVMIRIIQQMICIETESVRKQLQNLNFDTLKRIVDYSFTLKQG